MPVSEQTPTIVDFETRLPRHRHSADAINMLGDRAVLFSIEEQEQKTSHDDAMLMLDISVSDENFGGFTDIKDEDNFFAELGIKVPRTETFFIKDKDLYQKHRHKDTVAHYGAKQERIYLSTSQEVRTGLDKSITKALYVHELAHASSYWGPFPTVDKKLGKVSYLSARTGLSTDRKQEDHFEKQGELLEEAFAYYIQGQYVKSRGLNFRNFIDGSIHNNDFMSAEMDDYLGIFVHPESEFLKSGLKDKLRVIKMATEDKNIMFYPWYFIQGEKSSNIAFNMPAATGMAFELIIEDDPTFFDALKSSRYEVAGLREVASKLDALEKGLYKQLRDLEQTPEGIFSFYKSVTDALNNKLSSKPVE
jgi:hypothetical protein